ARVARDAADAADAAGPGGARARGAEEPLAAGGKAGAPAGLAGLGRRLAHARSVEAHPAPREREGRIRIAERAGRRPAGAHLEAGGAVCGQGAAESRGAVAPQASARIARDLLRLDDAPDGIEGAADAHLALAGEGRAAEVGAAAVEARAGVAVVAGVAD